MSIDLKRVQVKRLFDAYDLDVPIQDNTLILVGENGSGKSTLINLIYYTLTAQWERLKELPFKSCIITIGDEEYPIERASLPISKTVQSSNREQILFLPTYRRIEKELRDFCPDRRDFDDFFYFSKRNRYRKKQQAAYIELVELGIKDVPVLPSSVFLSDLEPKLRKLVDLVNQYLSNKKLGFNSDKLKLIVTPKSTKKNKIPLSVLSFGEKQIISLFSHIFLSDYERYFVVIDEPELSISVPWQRRFLQDLKDTGKCSGLIAVTHSPFVFENSLAEYAHSISEFIRES